MEAVEFKRANGVYAKDQPEYNNLPSHKAKDGIVTSCWKCSFAERLKVLLFGRVFVSCMTFNSPLQPLKVSAGLPEEASDDNPR